MAKVTSKGPGPQDRKVWLIQQAVGWSTLILSYFLWDRVVVPRWGLNQLPLASLSDRLVWALRLQLPAIWTVMIGILYVIYLRITNPAARNPLAGNEHVVQVGHHVLSNTIEQWLIHVANSLMLASWLDDSRLRLLPLLSFLFFVGRIAFLVGYHISPHYRAVGFVLTFIPNLGALGYNSWFLWTLGASARLGGRA